ncbi:flagellar basal body-associated protein FliL [Xylophilus sp. GOD-11R]|uniref:flagellar basal body-associated FliL family protein n=1 Tax=Xylophilus sp. GOD-11R TaxID=3089814 RepID=UPI00298BCC61|nr:flagellar basal body-associated FliL family protein [Xylophilus sp. GOD-11R]WPB57784.1 flagellar basal body-associated FliL family protein [Xylophilus sp. GOD-11R]
MADAAPKPKSKKKLMVIVIGLVVVLAVAGGAAMFLMKKNAATDEDGEEAAAPAAHAKHDDKNPPTFLPIDNLVVNLADPGGERFAQIGITFQMADSHSADSLKTNMPRVRSAILMLTSQRSSEELLSRDGKLKLAKAISDEASRTFGIEPEDEEDEDEDAPKKKKKKRKAQPESPVQGVLFSSFIVQ